MQPHQRNNIRTLRKPRKAELKAWRTWFPRRKLEDLVDRYIDHGGYICLPGGGGAIENQPAPAPFPGPDGGGQAA